MSLAVFTGPMFSGKSSKMLKKVTKYADISDEHTCIVINHGTDTRDRQHIVSSHSSQYKGLSEKIDVVSTTVLAEVDVKNYHVIGIDEVQLFPDLFATVKTWVDSGKHVICAGLDGNFKMERWGNVADLLPIADTFVKLSAVCSLCIAENRGKMLSLDNIPLAAFTGKIGGDPTKILEIGGSETYRPCCRKHHAVLGCVTTTSITTTMPITTTENLTLEVRGC